MYDFVLFENFPYAYNHYKDICIIAEYLSASGYTVAIVDLFQESTHCHIPGIPHISLKTKCKVSYIPSNNKHFAFINNCWKKIWIDQYITSAVKEIKEIGRNFYVGSYHCGMSLGWIKELASEKKVFFWGLRSSRLMEFKLRPYSLVGINGLKLWNYIRYNQNICFFVSDELIFSEFSQLGLDNKRLIVRPERYIRELPVKNVNYHKETILLTIGTLRPSKRVELSLNALSKIDSGNFKFIIAGKTVDEYENIISKCMIPVANVVRKNYRIPEKEYQDLFKTSDFLVVCDKLQPSLVTNGTMNEALLNGMPIIAPNYNPYKFFVEKYNIGLLYDPNDQKSLSSAFIKASKLGKQAFHDNILLYCKNFLFPNIVECFKSDIRNKI